MKIIARGTEPDEPDERRAYEEATGRKPPPPPDPETERQFGYRGTRAEREQIRDYMTERDPGDEAQVLDGQEKLL